MKDAGVKRSGVKGAGAKRRRPRRLAAAASIGLRAALLVRALRRLMLASAAAPPVEPGRSLGALPSISVVIPARDEAGRVAAAVAPLVGAPAVVEVLVVDDQSTDDTSLEAGAAGAVVISGTDRPPGWAGKTWALEQGRRRCTGEWVVTIDADVRPDPGLPAAIVERAMRDDVALLTAAGRFECPTGGARWLHASMLTTLVYRFGPPGGAVEGDRMLANGQCMAFDRAEMEAAGGFAPVAAEVVEDVALVRAWVASGRSTGFVDAAALMTVRMYDDFASTWTGWGRSIALPGVEPRWRQALDLAMLVATMPLPLARAVAWRVDVIDLVALLARLGTLVGTRRAYAAGGPAYWLSPLADGVSAAAVALSALRRRQRWKGRHYVVTGHRPAPSRAAGREG